MTMPPKGSEIEREVFALCDEILDGKISEENNARLEALVLTNPEARRAYVEYMQLSAALRQTSAGLASGALEDVLQPFPESGSKRTSVLPWVWKIAAAFVLGTGIPSALWLNRENSHVATLVEVSGARWETCVFATEVGAKVRPGNVRLAEGLARFSFRNGVDVTLEGPAELEVQGVNQCWLKNGALVAHVPPSGKGFVVQTDYAKLTDLGTEFGIRTDRSGDCAVHVLNGTVELQHVSGAGSVRLSTGQLASINAREILKLERTEGESTLPSSVEGDVGRIRSFTHEITTTNGGGAAAYVSSPGTKLHFSDTLLLLKNARVSGFLRKVLLRFDLSSIGGRSLESARLTLNFDRTGFGFASLNQDAQFAVYGITNDALDGWDPGTVSWENMPAHSERGGEVDVTQATRVGTFVLPRGVVRGSYYIEGDAIARYLQQDVNQLVTLVIVCESEGAVPASVVYGIAGNNHPTLPPPTLRLRITQ
ncbi:MAG: DNRLRE domain-containing protein [Verrucomicrobiota bacterium]